MVGGPTKEMNRMSEFILFSKKQLESEGRQEGYDALVRIQNAYSYRAPECQGSLWNDLFTDFIVPYVVPFDTEPWAIPIKQQWAQAMQAVNTTTAS